MGRHRPTIIWPTKQMGVYPQIYVRTEDENRISFVYHHEKGQEGFGFKLPRRHARLLARRINQCLDETKS